MARILVTGAAGFIGFHCAVKLRSEGHDVLGIDNFNDYYDPTFKQARADVLRNEHDVEVKRLDFVDQVALFQLFKSFKPELVLHLGAQAGVRYSIDHPEVYGTSNFMGTLNIMEACRHHDVTRLVYASSSSVYGGNTKLPFSESDSVDAPISLYAATKKANELTAYTYSHLYGLQTVGLRFFTVYGPWGRPDMAMWLFTKAILEDKPIKVFNHGDMQRDFTYVDDIVLGVRGALFSDRLNRYEVINLGNHRSEQLTDLIAHIEAAIGKTAEKIFMPMQPGDVKATYADISQAREKLDFEPSTNLADGVPRFVDWFKAHPHFHNA